MLSNEMSNDPIRSKQATYINKNELHFTSTFIIDASSDYEDYSLIVPFGILSANQPIKMDPIKITVNN